jgi:F420H(2)-dependent quinone reductase
MAPSSTIANHDVPRPQGQSQDQHEVGTQRFTVRAEELDDTAPRLWPRPVAEAPQLSDFQAKITRQIPVFMLTRRD